MTPIDFFLSAVQRHPDAEAAVVLSGNGEVIERASYKDLERKVLSFAAAMQTLTGQQRPRVVLVCHNSMSMLTAILATYLCRGVLIPLTPNNPEAELRDQLQVAKPDVIVIDDTMLGLGQGQTVPVVRIGAPQDGQQPFEALLTRFANAQPQVPEARGEEIIALKFTGGSSGRPKAVLQSVRCLNTMISSIQQVYAFTSSDRFLLSPPMTHGAGAFVLPVLASGGTLVIMDGARSGQLLDAMSAYEVTGIWVPPTLMYQMLDAQEAYPRILPQLRNLLYGGAGATMERLLQARTMLGPVIGVTYGLTEAPVIIAGMPGSESVNDANLGSAGRTGPLTRLAVMGAGGVLCAPNELGEVVARGDLLMSGYLDMPDATAQVMTNGWLKTGDVGYLDARGYLYIKGRSKDVIISGGFNIYPSDVEDALAQHDDVAESVVFGIPDAHWGERVEAAVELKHGRSVTPDALRNHVREKLGPVRTPKAIHLITDLPRNSLGKVQKRQLRDELVSQFANA